MARLGLLPLTRQATTMIKKLFAFPNPVNEISARIVASGVVVMALLTIILDQPWMTAVIAYGFIARVLTGPTLSPLGQLATRVITPRLPFEPQYCAGPPKRFAQGIGVVFSLTAAILALGFDETTAAYWVLGGLIFAASLEAYLGICLGCKAFSLLMKVGLIPEEVCERCNNISLASPSA
ncbi:MAG: DUF4395 domain-containing protein [Actinomycetes bacterium]